MLAASILLLVACKQDVIVGYRDDAALDVLPEITWLSGAHAGNELADYIELGQWRGRPLDIAQVFTDRTGGWNDILEPTWPVAMFETFAGKLVISQPLYPEGEGNNQACAAGDYDDDWARFGTFLSAQGRGDSIIRLGWGFNDTTHEWRADADLTDWITCFQRVAQAIRSAAPDVQFDWSFDAHGASYVTLGDPFAAYPGDDYVDYIGIEAFDRFPSAYDDATWDAKCESETGLCRVMDFARAHDKRVGIAEWGVVSCGEGAGGDNPFFVRKIVETFAANADVMAYEAYFEDGSLSVCSSLGETNPEAAAMYRRIYQQP